MQLSRREKLMLIVGGALVGLTVLIAWVVVPLGRKWREMGRQLSPRLETLATLRERTEQRGSLLVRRNRLAKEIGMLVPPHPALGQKGDAQAKKQEPEQESEEADKNDAEAREGANEKENEPKKEAPDPENDSQAPELEAKLEKTFAGCGAELKLLTVKRVSRLGLRPEHFRMVGFQVQTETKVESLVKLLHALEKGPRFMRVDRLRLHHEEGKPGRVSVSVEIVAYERVAEG